MKLAICMQVHKEWIRNDLLAAGADFWTCRWDQFSLSSGSISQDNDEKEESERLSKTAGLFVAAALLVLTVSFQMPFNVADKKTQSASEVLGPKAREEIFATLAQFDAASWAVSALSIFFCTAAAFPVAGPAGIMLRSVAIHLGRSLFLVASTITAMVFALGLSLVYIFPLWWHVFFCQCSASTSTFLIYPW